MDVCHLLLGRPWQYDRRTTQDGFANTYALSYENRRINLLPSQDTTAPSVVSRDLQPPPMQSGLTRTILLLSKTAFANELQTADVVALVTSPATETFSLTVRAAFADLINEFMDVFPP